MSLRHLDQAQQDVQGPEGAFSGGVLRKKLYDQSLSDWSARYRKNKQTLENLSKECEQIRVDVARQQQDADDRTENFRQLEDKFANEIFAKYSDMKASYEMATQQKSMLSVQLSENRKHKQQLLKEKKMLTSDYERKHAELMRMSEVHDKLDSQLMMVSHQLGQLTSDRRKMERELDEVQHNLRANTELADEVSHEINHVQHGIQDSMDLHMAAVAHRVESSVSSRRGRARQVTGGGGYPQIEAIDSHTGYSSPPRG